MNRMKKGLAIWTLSVIILAACGTDEVETPGTITAEITCTAGDSLLATVYLADGDGGAASQWCPCTSEACSVEFSGLGYGDYLLGIGRPDSLYKATKGAEGFTPTLGYYGEDGLAQAGDTISLSAEQPTSNVVVSLDGERRSGSN